ncbi:hypothetical protein [Vibrio rhodolitus]|uniref:hypothetical protein n=1 Tax=Vibrio rhodolitus TaxID=2231649 RepID=UPI000E0A47CD|nr:hypothetical protein [Vibrio rhodolitus]
MARDDISFDANCEEDLSILQNYIAELVAYVELRAINKNQQTQIALRESQYRLIKYKELLLHAEYIDETDLLLMYTELSKVEKSIAKLGVEALTIAINQLDNTFINS